MGVRRRRRDGDELRGGNSGEGKKRELGLLRGERDLLVISGGRIHEKREKGILRGKHRRG